MAKDVLSIFLVAPLMTSASVAAPSRITRSTTNIRLGGSSNRFRLPLRLFLHEATYSGQKNFFLNTHTHP